MRGDAPAAGAFAPVAQLDRAADFGSAGWGFDSLRAYSESGNLIGSQALSNRFIARTWGIDIGASLAPPEVSIPLTGSHCSSEFWSRRGRQRAESVPVARRDSASRRGPDKSEGSPSTAPAKSYSSAWV